MTLAALVAVLTVSAQGPQRGEMTPEQQAERLKQRVEAVDKAVTLSDEEKVKVEEIFKDSDEKMQEIFKSEDREANRTKMQELREDQEKKLTEVLGEERFKKYQESQPQRGQGQRGDRPAPRD